MIYNEALFHCMAKMTRSVIINVVNKRKQREKPSRPKDKYNTIFRNDGNSPTIMKPRGRFKSSVPVPSK